MLDEHVMDIKVSVARVEEQLGALITAVKEDRDNSKVEDAKQDLRLDKLETTKWRQWIAIVLISAGVNAPPWLLSMLG